MSPRSNISVEWAYLRVLFILSPVAYFRQNSVDMADLRIPLSLSLSLSFYLSLSLYVYFDVSRIRFLWTMQRRKFNRTEAFRARNEISRLMDFERLIRWLKVNSREWILWQVHGKLPTLKLRIISVQINVNRESNRAVLD